MNCPKCGNPLIPNMKFCTKCGTPVPQKPTAPQQPVRPQAPVMPQQPVNKTQQTPARPKEYLQYDAPKKQPSAPQNVVKPQPPKPPVQPTYQQNNPPQVQPQITPQSFVSPQITPQSFAVQPQNPPKKKKSNKNLPLIIVAVVLVLAVLASTIAVVPGIIRNKNEVNAATEYIEEFPILKQQTSLLVYDINKFPSEKYEIKVEKMFMGGVLNGVFKGKTILEDVSTEHVYDLDFEKDGDYRITLTDKTEPKDPTGSEYTDVIEIVIIIDVKVDDDAEDAVDNVDLNADTSEVITDSSVQDSAAEFLEATDEDFKELEKTLVNMDSLGRPTVYSCDDSDAYHKLLRELLEEIQSTTFYKYIYNKEAEYVDSTQGYFKSTPEQLDPLKKFVEYYRYGKVPADEIDWIIKNIFNVTPDRANSTVVSEYSGSTFTEIYCYDNYYYFSCGDGGDCGSYPVIKTKQADENNVYIVEFDLFNGVVDDDYDDEFYGSYKAVCALKMIDGKKYWTFYSIEQIATQDDKKYDIPADAFEFNGHYYKLYDMTGKTWEEAQNYCESLGGHLATITSQEEQDFVHGMIPSQTNSRLYWLGSYYTYNEWIWVTGETFDYSNWAPGEPSGGQNYMTLLGSYFKEDSGKWLDNPSEGCSEPWTLSATAFICEWE